MPNVLSGRFCTGSPRPLLTFARARSVRGFRNHAIYWASEASPTLGCSIEISRGMSVGMYVGMYVCLSYVKSRGIT